MQPPIDLKARHNARKHLVQALYQQQLTHQTIREVELQFLNEYLGQRVDLEYFSQLLYRISKSISKIDQAFSHYVSRPMQDIDPIELAVLRLATFELLNRIEIPHQIVINEALELAKTFGSQDSHRFVNGILDKVARDTRPLEYSVTTKN